MTALTIVVHDMPAPQGSKRHVGRGIMVESSKRVKPWREAVKQAALDAMNQRGYATLDGPVSVDVVFTLPRPRGHFLSDGVHFSSRASRWPGVRPDLDKLLRSTLDALTAAAVFGDDAQVVSLLGVKSYPGGHMDALSHPGAFIRVSSRVPWTPDEAAGEAS